MASWQFALQLAKEEMAKICGPYTVPQVLIVNEECQSGDTSLAGSVRWDPDTQTYEVYNVNTHECRHGLVSKPQVEDALFEIDVANSDWYGIAASETKEYALCYHIGLSFFYHHAEHPRESQESEPRHVPLSDLAPGTICCGCWQPIESHHQE